MQLFNIIIRVYLCRLKHTTPLDWSKQVFKPDALAREAFINQILTLNFYFEYIFTVNVVWPPNDVHVSSMKLYRKSKY